MLRSFTHTFSLSLSVAFYIQDASRVLAFSHTLNCWFKNSFITKCLYLGTHPCAGCSHSALSNALFLYLFRWLTKHLWSYVTLNTVNNHIQF